MITSPTSLFYWCGYLSPATCRRGDAASFSGANVSRASRLRARDPQVHPPAAGFWCGFVVVDTVELRHVYRCPCCSRSTSECGRAPGRDQPGKCDRWEIHCHRRSAAPSEPLRPSRRRPSGGQPADRAASARAVPGSPSRPPPEPPPEQQPALTLHLDYLRGLAPSFKPEAATARVL